MIFYFSGTGNSLWAARQISSKLVDDKVYSIPSYMHKNEIEFCISENESLGFVFPVYSWGPPQIVIDFIDAIRIKLKGNNFIYFVCTCGDDTGKTAEIIKKLLLNKGLRLNAGYSVIMPNTYICLPGFDTDSTDIRNRKLSDSIGRVNYICDSIIGKKEIIDCNEGSMPRIKSYIIRPLFNKYCISADKFHVNNKCISCRKCEKACPLSNIVITNGTPNWGKNCTMCLACYHNCPVHAIEYGSSTRKKGQYTHPGI